MYQGSDQSIGLWSLQSIVSFCATTGWIRYLDGELTFHGITTSVVKERLSQVIQLEEYLFVTRYHQNIEKER